MNKTIFCIVFIATLLYSCSSDEPRSPEERPIPSDNIYLEFNKWVYSQMNRQYLWREDLPDSLSCNYDLGPRNFFYSLLSDKDRFSYFTSNSNYSGGSAYYGFAYQSVKDCRNNQALEVLYVTSPKARQAGLHRGDFVRIKSVDSQNITLSRASLQDNVLAFTGDDLEFSLNDPSSQESTVLLDTIYTIEDHRIGYLCYLEFDEIDDLYEPLQRFTDSQITDLILDLRYNPGGYVRTSQYLSNCIVPASGYGNLYQQCSYNDVLSREYLRTTGSERTYSYFDFPHDPGEVTLSVGVIPLSLKRLYVITSTHTASASEATIICLRPYMEVTLIGETTVGKGVGSWTISESKYRYALHPITMRYYNAEGLTTPDEGLEPDYYVPDAYKTGRKDIGDTSETLLAAALAVVLNRTVPQPLGAPRLANAITPIGEPSFVTDFRNQQFNISNWSKNDGEVIEFAPQPHLYCK